MRSEKAEYLQRELHEARRRLRGLYDQLLKADIAAELLPLGDAAEKLAREAGVVSGLARLLSREV